MVSLYPPQGNLAPTIVIGEIDDATLVIESETIASNDNDTTFPTSAAVFDLVVEETYTRTGVITFTAPPVFNDNVKVAFGSTSESTIVDTGSGMLIDIDEQNAGSKSLVIESDATALLTINDTIASLSIPLDVSDIECDTLSERDGTLHITLGSALTTFAQPIDTTDIELDTISERDGTLAITVGSALVTFAQPIDVSDIETATVSARDGSLAITIADTTGVSTFVSGAVLVAPVLGTPASGDIQNCTAYTGDSSLVTVGTIATGVWEGTAVTSANLDADTAHLGVTQTFTGAKTFNEDITLSSASIIDVGNLNLADKTRIVIATGAVTATQTYHSVDGESDTDDSLDTLNGGTAGDLIYLRPDDDAATITITDAGNIILEADADFVMSDIADMWHGIYDGTNWIEISRSLNHV